MVVNPYHLPKIRCWMHIIESNPPLFERLAAALNVQLRLGGVYIADTDLFQRDVSRFLSADLQPIYFVAKQLLRTLPVYFSDVGAEGELRAVSTQIDELCGRRDTLMHFLRKQAHAESSNRLVAFSRAVLRYWLTLQTAGLEPYLSANTLAQVRDERHWAAGPHARARGAAAPPWRRGRGRCRPRPRAGQGARRARRSVARRSSSWTACWPWPRPSWRRIWRRCPRTAPPPARPMPARTPARGPAGAHLPVAHPEVLTVGRRRGRRRGPPSAACAARAPPLRAGARGLADGPHAGGARPPAGRRPAGAGGAQGHRAHARPLRGHGEHLPEAPHRRRHPLHLRQLQRAEASTPWACRSAWRSWWAACWTTSWPRASSPT